MLRYTWPVLGLLILVSGCVPLDIFKTTDPPNMPTVGLGSFGIVPPAESLNVASFTPSGDTKLGMLVDSVSRKIKSKNLDMGLQPNIALIGTPTPEMFHQGTHLVWITEGLVKACKTDGELAALLCLEMGKMVSEREANANYKARQEECHPPLEALVGNAGQSNATDGIHLVEVAKQEKQRTKRLPPPDPQVLARIYLENAGYNKSELNNVEELVRTANRNYIVEKQFQGTNGASWTTAEQSH